MVPIFNCSLGLAAIMRSSLCFLFLFSSSASALWPIPQTFNHGNSSLWLSESLQVTYNGQTLETKLQDVYPDFLDIQTGKLGSQVPLAQFAAAESVNFSSFDIVQSAVSRTYHILFSQNLIPWKFHPRNQLSQFEPSEAVEKVYLSSIEIIQTGSDTASTFKPLAGEVDESYNLTIAQDGTTKISAVSSIGVLHALETFTQLFYEHSSGKGVYTVLAPVDIIDAPKFAHRGLNLDVARNWFPVSKILHMIDALSWNKFNRLHLHIVDAQSWPIEIPSLPELSEKGAYLTGLTYSPSEIERIQTYAVYRGVEIILEFDTPGHTSVVGLAYPDLIAAQNAKPWNTYCAEPPCGQLKLNSSAVDTFISTLWNDLIPRIKSYSSYLHTGGDEVNLNVYELDETVKSSDRAVIKPYLQKFMDRSHEQIRAAGLTPMVWEEMVTEWDLVLGEDVVVQSWLSEKSVEKIVKGGHKTIAGSYQFWYLDCGAGQWLSFHEGASYRSYYPFNDYCSPTKNWRLIYSYDPTANLTPSEASLVIGGEVHIWSEQTDPVNLDTMVWPRAAAAAEVLWSGGKDVEGKVRSQLDAAERLGIWRERLVNRGIHAGPVQMVFCTQHDPDECSL
ncbi:glycoside hydrolase superfamily [Xylogone sp. PMI_703]|nr:glycoside hydrolase superfamily [Xylogone sp. PMI_703]